MSDERGQAAAGFLGALMILGGVLIAALCGLCTLVMIGTGLSSGGRGQSGIIVLALVIGGIPTAFGGILIWGGIMVARNAQRPAPKVKLDTFD